MGGCGREIRQVGTGGEICPLDLDLEARERCDYDDGDDEFSISLEEDWRV